MNIKSSSIASFLLLLYTLFLFPLRLSFFIKEKSILIDWTFTEINSCHINITILLDRIRLRFSNVVCFISRCVLLFSSSYISRDPFLKRFTWLVILFVISINLLVFIPSLPALLLGWDGLGITSFVLVIYYQNNKSLGAGILTLLTNRIGDVIILLSIGLLVLIGNWNISLLWDFPLLFLLVIAIILAGITKRAQIPFSSWLPAAMAAPTPVSALVHSSTLVTAGVFLLIRFYPTLRARRFFEESLIFVAVLTLLIAGVGANFENDLKKVIALSTLSQLGVIIISLSINLPNLALFHLYTHALFKALLFLCAGAIIHGRNNNQDIRKIGLIRKQLPLTTTCINIANLSLCGAPFLRGFYSKDLILEIALIYPTNYLIILIIFVATGITAAYTLRLSFSLLWGAQKRASLHSKHEADSYVNISTCALAIIAIISGIFLQIVFLPFEIFRATLRNFQKRTTILVIITGIFISLFFWKLRINESIKFKVFCSSIWFLVLLSTQPAVGFSSVFGRKLIKTSDQGWIEILGGQRAWKGRNRFRIMIQSIRRGIYINIIFVSLIRIFLILLISYLL